MSKVPEWATPPMAGCIATDAGWLHPNYGLVRGHKGLKAKIDSLYAEETKQVKVSIEETVEAGPVLLQEEEQSEEKKKPRKKKSKKSDAE
ncbi:MAG: hypothetical protein BV459_03960 [Thermoplasmata archaeon M11B2D]|nr:MAG: hypothetical protein BV459_03960 [Thermoplasmata archaeon M11B2D]